MIKKTVTYEDFNGEQQTEDLYFHLNKAELAEINFKAGDLENRLKVLMATGRRGAVIDWFKEILLKSYGVRSDDGTRFVKDPEVVASFAYSNAYEVIFMELISDPIKAQEFIAGTMGKKRDDLGTPALTTLQ